MSYRESSDARDAEERAVRMELPCPCCQGFALFQLHEQPDGPMAAWMGRCPKYGAGRVIYTTREDAHRALTGGGSRG
jgi:hypothetical protein